MAVTMAKPAVAAPSSTAPQRVGPLTRVGSGASQPEFQVPEVDSIMGVGARAPDTDPSAGWLGSGGEGGGRRRPAGQEIARGTRETPAAVRPTTVSDVILASQIATRRLGPVPMPRSEVTVAVGVYDHAIQAVTGTLPRTFLGTSLDVAL
ncbi:hypothetical protein [Roseospira visakhapatnamensis]|uniref:Uncharacterized protein n=1 Tax=Roseospira visakhapatnamensis TaxID=390880 RepID=A0A7W6RHZ6_9PROT|nr:hypothetical protein [Roseospira visakhapatnamensis]MBB4268243.1 hypothetical protein [Roseospira visakhapatnamensis]